jgi:hypothetical protein
MKHYFGRYKGGGGAECFVLEEKGEVGLLETGQASTSFLLFEKNVLT